MLLLAQVPCDVPNGGGFLTCFIFLVAFHGEKLVDSAGMLLRSCLSSCVAMLSNLLLFGVCNQPQSLQSLLFSSIFCLINLGQSYVLTMYVLALRSNLPIVLYR
jgi:hypothetical protein